VQSVVHGIGRRAVIVVPRSAWNLRVSSLTSGEVAVGSITRRNQMVLV
jgi:hypothetical protein